MNNEDQIISENISEDAKSVMPKAASSDNKASKQPVRAKSQSRFVKRLKIILLCILLFLAVFFVGVQCYFKLPVKQYLAASKRTFTIPDINRGFIAQGLCYDEASDAFYLTGYMKDGSASPIYVVSKSSGKLEHKVLMTNPDGSDYSGHAGGISYYEGLLYICGCESNSLLVFNPEDVLSAKNGDKISCVDVVELSYEGDYIRSDFSTVIDGMLFVGEFFKEPNYPTCSLHTIETFNGSQNAYMVGFKIINGSFTPQVVYSLPDQIQGACFTNDNIYLSSSFGPSFSKLYEYPKKELLRAGTRTVLGVEVPLFILDANNPKNLIKTSPMSEELEYVDGRLYTMCESASDKYIFGKLLGAWKVYATDLDKAFD